MQKRLFFGFSVRAPWPETYPEGRILEEEDRHITLAFLGNVEEAPLIENLSSFPPPPFPIGPSAVSDRILFLPHDHARVVAYHLIWLSLFDVGKIHQKLLDWLENLGYEVDRRPFLSHVTIARAPFHEKEWEKSFSSLPFYVSGIHLYESVGNLRYVSRWEYPLLAPFEEFEHTADIGFKIRGETFHDLYVNAALALSFQFPPLIKFVDHTIYSSLNQVIQALNKIITAVDLEIGSPFKAISYHGSIQEMDGYIEWDMFVDV